MKKKKILLIIGIIFVLIMAAFIPSGLSNELIIPTVDRATISDIPPIK